MYSSSIKRAVKRQAWRYGQAGKDWRDGLLLGNGNLGVMAYAPGHLEWVINKVDVFDPSVEEGMAEKVMSHKEFLSRIDGMKFKNTLFLNDAEAGPAERNRIRDTLSAAVLRLRFWQGIGWAAPAMPQTSQHLSLYDGELEECVDSHSLHPRLTMFTPRGTNLFCVRISEVETGQKNIFELLRPTCSYLQAPKWENESDMLSFFQPLPGGESAYAAALVFVPQNPASAKSGYVTRDSDGEFIQCGNTDLFLAVCSSFESEDPLAKAKEMARKGAEKGFVSLQMENRSWWHDYWDGAYADFGKYTNIQKYFTFGLYEIASSFGKAPMPGLNGLSYGPLDDKTPGVNCQGYTHDQNAQIPSMAFLPLNRVKFVRVLADTYLTVADTLRAYTKRLFGCSGIFLPLATNQLGREYPTRSYRYTLNGSAYTGMILSMAWKYSHDKELLKDKIYPLLREFVEFYTGIMHKGDDGRYHLDWSVPPEIFTLTRDESSTISMLRVCLETLVETAPILNMDNDRITLWQDMLSSFPEIAKHPTGAFWCGPDVPHDHYFFGGHILYPFFPAGISDDIPAALKTLELIDNESIERSFDDRSGEWHFNHDWSAFLTTCTRFRAGDKVRAWKELGRFLELFAKENGLFSHDPIIICSTEESERNRNNNLHRLKHSKRWCDGSILKPGNPEIPESRCATPNPDAKRLAPAVIEGNSAFVFMAAEALLQSHNGAVRLFPGVPDDFTGFFRRFLAEGGFEVSAKMISGKVKEFSIHSISGGKLKVILPDGTCFEAVLESGGSFDKKLTCENILSVQSEISPELNKV
jgi:hypothetical protein